MSLFFLISVIYLQDKYSFYKNAHFGPSGTFSKIQITLKYPNPQLSLKKKNPISEWAETWVTHFWAPANK